VILTDVGLYSHDNVEQHKAPDGEAVTVKQPGDESGAEPHNDELPGVEVLGDPAEGAVILVVYGM